VTTTIQKKVPRVLPTQYVSTRRFAAAVVFTNEGGIGHIKFFEIIFCSNAQRLDIKQLIKVRPDGMAAVGEEF
jgi:hypothetical protein